LKYKLSNIFFFPFIFLLFSCYNKQKEESIVELNLKIENREIINEHVRELAENLVAQPVMTPRPGFSGYLAHMQVIKSTTKESPFVVITEGEGLTIDGAPSELQDFINLKGKHPYGGTYAFSSNDIHSGAKDRNDLNARLVLEIPGKEGDGLMAVGFSDGRVITIPALSGNITDKMILEILSVPRQ
jgi:hypothetical protein